MRGDEQQAWANRQSQMPAALYKPIRPNDWAVRSQEGRAIVRTFKYPPVHVVDLAPAPALSTSE